MLTTLKKNIRRNLSKFKWKNSENGQKTISNFNSLKDSYKGKDAIILCNGPSLNKVNFDQLENTFVIGLNKINLLFERTDFRPNMIVAINKYVIEQNVDFYNNTEIPLYIADINSKELNNKINISLLNSFSGYNLDFSLNPGLIIYEGWTVTYTALQIAYHMGFNRIAIVGADHNFNQTGTPNELQISKGPDSNHFDPRYFSNGIQWQLADLEGSEQAYSLAKKMFELKGKKIYNCTEGGKLEIFERMSINDFLHKNN